LPPRSNCLIVNLVKALANTDIIVTTPENDLNSVMQKFTIKNIDSLPVVKDDDHGILIGMINRREGACVRGRGDI